MLGMDKFVSVKKDICRKEIYLSLLIFTLHKKVTKETIS